MLKWENELVSEQRFKIYLKIFFLNFFTCLNVPNIVAVNKCLSPSICCFISLSLRDIASGIVRTVQLRGVSIVANDFNTTHEATRERLYD